MAQFKKPSFKQRAQDAAKAKQAALDNFLKARELRGDASVEIAEARRAREAREAVLAKESAERRIAREKAKAARKAKAQENLELEHALSEPSDKEKRAAFSARYRSRKASRN